ncbi:MAG: substrate-binding domain-containing protein [Candidatus Hydrothermarchaeales archaeon]
MNSRTLILAALITLFSACLTGSQSPPPADSIVLATTTSTYDSGLLDYLLPAFTGQTGIEVRVISVGTGQALELGRRGDADVLLVHSPADEKRFVTDGFGVARHCVMYNDFVILGPSPDPAGISNTTAAEALSFIAKSDSTFISRGDDSGTHKKELLLWTNAGVEDKGVGYIESGTGMGLTLLTAGEKQAYTLSDRATFVSMKDRLDLAILVSGDTLLLNPYAAIAVNPVKNPGVNSRGAEAFVQWITGADAQRLIGEYRKKGERLFTPLQGRCLEDSD